MNKRSNSLIVIASICAALQACGSGDTASTASSPIAAAPAPISSAPPTTAAPAPVATPGPAPMPPMPPTAPNPAPTPTLPAGIQSTSEPISLVTNGGNLFAYIAGKVATSSDATTWTNFNSGPSADNAIANSIVKVRVLNGVFLSLGSSSVKKSSNGLNWFSLTGGLDAKDAAFGVVNGAPVYVFVGSSEPGSHLGLFYEGANLFGLIPGSSSALSTNNEWRSVTFGKGVFVAVSAGGRIATSTNGQNWAQATNLAIGLKQISYAANINGGTFIAIGDAGQYSTSTDGSSWGSVQSTGQLADLTQIECIATECVVATANLNRSSQLFSTRDFVTWSNAVTIQDQFVSGIANTGSHWIAVGPSSLLRIRSNTGTTWCAALVC